MGACVHTCLCVHAYISTQNNRTLGRHQQGRKIEMEKHYDGMGGGVEEEIRGERCDRETDLEREECDRWMIMETRDLTQTQHLIKCMIKN